jgi:hypothetical protein
MPVTVNKPISVCNVKALSQGRQCPAAVINAVIYSSE